MSEEDRIHHSVEGPRANLLHTQPRNYDMDDSQKDLQRWPKLAPVLYDCETALGEAFHRSDASARIYETRYKILASSAAISLVLVQLSLLMVEMPWWGRVGDFVAAMAAVGAVYALISRSRRLGISDLRLLERAKAERCRFLKFQFLSDVSLWSCLTSQARQDWLRSRVEQLSTLNEVDLILNEVDLKSWAEEKNEASEATSVGPAAHINEATLDQLIDYYYEKRLNYVINQLEFIVMRGYLYSRVDMLARICSKSFITLGLVAAVAYFIYNLSMPYSERDALSSALLFSSACLALVGETVARFRKAKGFGVYILRFRATSHELKQLLYHLEVVADPQAKLGILHQAERVLHVARRANLISQIDPRFSESGG